jgi:hypothetical protein
MITEKDIEAMKYHESYEDYLKGLRVKAMTPLDMVREFHTVYNIDMDKPLDDDALVEGSDLLDLRDSLVTEEYDELMEATSVENLLKELADLVYVCYGYAVTFGLDLDEALRRVHKSNMSKLDPDTGLPIYREDGKVMKGSAYKPPYLGDLV